MPTHLIQVEAIDGDSEHLLGPPLLTALRQTDVGDGGVDIWSQLGE